MAKILITIIFYTTLSISPLVARATTFTFTDQATFSAAYQSMIEGALDSEGFEGVSANNNLGATPITTSNLTASTSASAMFGVYNRINHFGMHATEGNNYFVIADFPPFTSNESIIIDLPSPLIGFGTTITDWGDFLGGTLTLHNLVGDNFVVQISPQTDGNEQFFGIINTDAAFDRIEITSSSPGEAYSVDELKLGECTEGLWDIGIGTPGVTDTRTAGIVYDFITFNDGVSEKLYASGFFKSVNGVSANYIASWDGSNWAPLGIGVDGSGSQHIYTMKVFDDGNGPALYVGGIFNSAGGIATKNVAKWDGTQWSSLGAGLGGTNDIVLALEVFDDGSGPALYAGGRFAGHIKKWNPTTQLWTTVGGGVTKDGLLGGVFDLLSYDDGSGLALYVGGQFTQAGGVAANRIAKWNGTSWSALGTGMAGGTTHPRVSVLESFDDGTGTALYAGGEFSSADGAAAKDIAKWDGSSWSALSGNFSGGAFGVLTLEVHNPGSGNALYVGGSHTSINGITINRIAKWDGSAWSKLAGGASDFVEGLFSYDNGGTRSLLVGGRFFTIGGLTTGRMAEWRPCP